MKTAKEWSKMIPVLNDEDTIPMIKEVQLDALNHALRILEDETITDTISVLKDHIIQLENETFE